MRLEIREEVVVEVVEGDRGVAPAMVAEVLKSVRLASDEECEHRALVLAEATEQDGKGGEREWMNGVGLFREPDEFLF